MEIHFISYLGISLQDCREVFELGFCASGKLGVNVNINVPFQFVVCSVLACTRGKPKLINRVSRGLSATVQPEIQDRTVPWVLEDNPLMLASYLMWLENPVSWSIAVSQIETFCPPSRCQLILRQTLGL